MTFNSSLTLPREASPWASMGPGQPPLPQALNNTHLLVSGSILLKPSWAEWPLVPWAFPMPLSYGVPGLLREKT
ncbi:hypothetical protein RHMOL_Rhmol01G0239500 [Rhododendron molle]|uniref:Uncharacterized protein n=1 Tax=Rhododendron molle TaxID=49168 RepID=A0ACC0Q872_RHOML|nr:hypothetical protein RHMOL_Rhmol01G0239500 [Rhododendron molle]